MGDKVAFISDRDIYLDVYVMDLNDKENVEKIM
jgi:Tol biopolymer transport system component